MADWSIVDRRQHLLQRIGTRLAAWRRVPPEAPPGGDIPEALKRDVGLATEFLGYRSGVGRGGPARMQALSERLRAGLPR